MIYLDNAATTFPKPESVYRAAVRCMREYGGNPGRSGHRLSREAAMAVLEEDSQLAKAENRGLKELMERFSARDEIDFSQIS